MSTPPPGELTRQLTRYTAHIPAPVAQRLAAAFAELTASGAAPGLAVGEQAPPFCNLELNALQAALPQLTERGPALIAISPQSPDHGLSWDLPVPATFVIDRGGIIRGRHVSAGYTTRMDPAGIAAALDELP